MTLGRMKITLNPVFLALKAGLLIVTLNALGAIPVLFMRGVSQRMLDVGLGFASGVMIAASFTSLIIPGIEEGGIAPVLAGIILGSITITLADRVIPHMHMIIGLEGAYTERLRALWLFVVAVTLHNMPEGLAVGVGFGSGDLAKASALAIAIGLQNIPEGMSIGFSTLSMKGVSKWKAFVVSMLSGAVELPLAVLGAAAISLAKPAVPYAMGFAAGAMLFVVSDEMIPETHRAGRERLASYGLMMGLMVMLTLDILLAA